MPEHGRTQPTRRSVGAPAGLVPGGDEPQVSRRVPEHGRTQPTRERVGAPGRARTCDPPLRRRALYPAELRARTGRIVARRRRPVAAPGCLRKPRRGAAYDGRLLRAQRLRRIDRCRAECGQAARQRRRRGQPADTATYVSGSWPSPRKSSDESSRVTAKAVTPSSSAMPPATATTTPAAFPRGCCRFNGIRHGSSI